MGAVRNIQTHKDIKILCVDDELAVLNSLKRVLRKQGFAVDIETSPRQALNRIINQNYDIIISDMRMPEMDGAEFFSAVEKFDPTSVRILITGYSDHTSTVRAINSGKIFSYINKPWDNSQLVETIDNAISFKTYTDNQNKKVHNLIGVSSKLDKKVNALTTQIEEANNELKTTLSILELTNDEHHNTADCIVQVFSNLINQKLKLPENMSQQISIHSKKLAELMGLNQSFQEDISNAALLYQAGKLLLPEHLTTKPYCFMSINDRMEFEQYPSLGAELLSPLKDIQYVTSIIHNHRENYDGTGYPDALSHNKIPFSSKILRVVIDFIESFYFTTSDYKKSLDLIISNSGKLYDPEIVQGLIKYCSQQFSDFIPKEHMPYIKALKKA